MRTVIFGVDGLTFRILQPLIERGDLPNFARLQHDGVTADFISTACPCTAPAWMSIATGLRPAKHGVFDFWDFDTTSAQPKAKLVTHRKGGKAIWNILSEFGKRVVVLNVPLTYPPEPVNGIMVSGLMTPALSSAYTFPPSFKEEIHNTVPDYRIDLSGNQMSAKQLYDQMMQITEKRIQLQEHLLTEHEWDFAFLCYVGPDRLQHHLWNSIMTLDHEATKYYRLLDEALGHVLQHLTSEDMLFVVSDHGFVGLSTRFYINEYLHRQNLLQIDSSLKRGQTKFIGAGRDVTQKLHLLNAANKIRNRYNKLRNRNTPIEKNFAFNDGEWSEAQTCVLSWTAFAGGHADIVISPLATVDDIARLRTALSNERNPATGEPLVRAMYTTDDLGEGPFRPRQEHLIIIPSPGITFHLLTGRKNLWEKEEKNQGCHEPEGVFYAYGAGIRRGVQVKTLQVYDLVPTILHALNITAKEPLDGHVAHEIFTEDRASYVEVGNAIVAHKLKQLRVDEKEQVAYSVSKSRVS